MMGSNKDQRYVELEILRMTSGRVYLRAPANSRIAPPGNWMLFVLNNKTPSEAATIRLQSGTPTFETVPSRSPLPSPSTSSRMTESSPTTGASSTVAGFVSILSAQSTSIVSQSPAVANAAVRSSAVSSFSSSPSPSS
jgi:hypothetical protein